jgi:hypothetical protein
MNEMIVPIKEMLMKGENKLANQYVFQNMNKLIEEKFLSKSNKSWIMIAVIFNVVIQFAVIKINL